MANFIKVRVMSNKGFPVPGVVVKFEPETGSGLVTDTFVFTDMNGYAQTSWSPTGTNGFAKLKAIVQDCDQNNILHSPLVFDATENATLNCTQSTLYANYVISGNLISPSAHMGVPPYTYSTDGTNFSSLIPQITMTTGGNYTATVKDSNGCTATMNYYNGPVNCNNSGLNLQTSVYGSNITASAQNGNPPYLFALDNGSYSSNATFTNLSVGSHLIRVKDNNNCVGQTIINITNSTNNLVAYFGLPQNINANQPIIFNNLSNNATSYSWNFGNGQTSTATNPTATYTYNGTYTITLTAYNGTNSDTFSRTIIISNGVTIGTYPANYVHCNSTPTVVVDVVNPTTGKTWMDRNLGASQVATSTTDPLAYGDLYQWGRFADGHQCRNSTITNTISNTEIPGHGNFIVNNNNWLNPENINLWQGTNGNNNPCPYGYRLPTINELTNERLSWSSNNASGAFSSPLKLSIAGNREVSGYLTNGGEYEKGIYWSSTFISGGLPYDLYFTSINWTNTASQGWDYNARGFSVRCIKN